METNAATQVKGRSLTEFLCVIVLQRPRPRRSHALRSPRARSNGSKGNPAINCCGAAAAAIDVDAVVVVVVVVVDAVVFVSVIVKT